MRSLNKWLVENQEVCARMACRDTGKTSQSCFRCRTALYSFISDIDSGGCCAGRDNHDVFKVGMAH
jgi:hypothetical protein